MQASGPLRIRQGGVVTLLRMIEGLLPGARTLRAPLIAGLLWALVLWILTASAIPNEATATGWVGQAYELADFLGPFTSTILALVAVFVLGAVAQAATEPIASVLGRGVVPVQSARQWQTHARNSRARMRREANAMAARRDKAGAVDREAASEKRRAEIQAMIDGIETRLGYIRRTAGNRKIFGLPPASSAAALEADIVEVTRDLARDEAIASSGVNVALETISDSRDIKNSARPLKRLAEEFQADPLDALQALDEQLYLSLDRERAERDVRLAICLPTMALGSVIAYRWTEWAWVLTALSAVGLLRYSLSRVTEKQRVVNLVSIRGLSTPALRLAAAFGRDDVRQYLATQESALRIARKWGEARASSAEDGA
jgi:hypothetical protein